MKKTFALIGAGGHAKVIIEIIEEMGGEIAMINDIASINSLHGYTVTQELPPPELPVIISVGNNKTRKKMLQK